MTGAERALARGLSRWLGRRGIARNRAARAGAAAVQRTVRRLDAPGREPATLAEQRGLAALGEHGPLPLGDLAARIAADLYRREIGRGGWLLELGVLGSGPFVPEAERAIESADGSLWTIEAIPSRAPARPHQRQEAFEEN